MGISETIKKVAPLFLTHKHLEDEDLVNILIEKDIPVSLARKLVVFMPIAFGRFFLSDLRIDFYDEYECYQKKGVFTDKQRRKLIDESVYRESLKIAEQMAGKETTGQTFLAVALRSSEVHAVNELELQGSTLEHVVLSRILIEWEIDEETQSPNAETTQTKNWWEFWK